MNKTYIIVGIYLYIWAMFQKNVWRCNLCSTLLQTLLEDLKKELVFHLQNAECAQPQNIRQQKYIIHKYCHKAGI